MPDIDYASIKEITTLTARFPTTDQLIEYLEGLYKGIMSLSGGRFDPVRNPAQRFKISTHLLRSKEDMLRAQKLGVNRYIYPLEIFDAERRKRYMTSNLHAESKGDSSFEEVLSVLETASSVFGRENVEVVVLVGIDTYDDTLNGINRLHSLGYRIVTYNAFRVYDHDQIDMYQMTLEEIVDAISYIEELFTGGFKQVVNFGNRHAGRLYRQL